MQDGLPERHLVQPTARTGQFVEFRLGRRRHEEAAHVVGGHQPLARKPVQGLAHGACRDGVMLGQRLHAQLHVRRQFARHDAVAEARSDAGGERRTLLATAIAR